jgi:hypothetical protein
MDPKLVKNPTHWFYTDLDLPLEPDPIGLYRYGANGFLMVLQGLVLNAMV